MHAVELFAGAGGAAWGLHLAGLEHLALVEWDAAACATLRAAGEQSGAWSPAAVWEGDVREWTRTEAPALAGSVDLLWASPPCQAWSTAGKRLGAADERNGWPWTWEAVDALRPAWLLAENVPGMLTHSSRGCGDPATCPGCYWHAVILPAARERFAWVGWRVLDAADYGVPQHRRRVFLACGPEPYRWPVPTHGSGLLGLRESHVGAIVALGRGLVHGGRNSPRHPRQEKPRDTRLPAPCLNGCGGSQRINHRRMTQAERAALQSFPAWWPWQGNKTERYRQVGNAVPPPMARALAGSLFEEVA